MLSYLLVFSAGVVSGLLFVKKKVVSHETVDTLERVADNAAHTAKTLINKGKEHVTDRNEPTQKHD